MRLRLTPRDDVFFQLLADAAANLTEGAQVLARLVAAEPAARAPLAQELRDIEHRGDEATHAIMRRLNTTFVTPFDREDIYSLASTLDDCMDFMEAAGDLVVLYRMDGLPDGVRRQVEILTRMAELTAAAMPGLRSISGLQEFWVEVNRLENEADKAYRSLVAELFDNTPDAVLLLKTKEIVDVLEQAADAFEKVANHVETIAVKES